MAPHTNTWLKSFAKMYTNLDDYVQLLHFECNIFHSVAVFHQMISNDLIIGFVWRNEYESNLRFYESRAQMC